MMNIPKQFSNIEFDAEKHKYYLDGKPLNKSVSSLVSHFGNPFDADAVATRMAERNNLDKQELLDSWKQTNLEACELGTITHEFAENYAWNKTLIPETGHQKAAKKFIDELPDYIEIVYTELMMYHFDYLFPGTADLILKDKRDNTYWIGDYKTNKDLFKNFAEQKLQSPFDYLLDNPFNHYQIQLSTYQLLLEQLNDFKVSNRRIVWLKSDGNYEMYDCNDYSEVIKNYLKQYYYELF